jgi:catechol-2,3-dioxygenase
MLGIRQIVLAARELESTVSQFQERLDLDVVHRDPGVAKFGLENALLRIGDQFLEIVSPTRADTAAGRHLERHGDSAYMLILQTDDLARDRHRIEQLGVRVVWESNHPEISAIHLHPKDMGAAIVSLDEARPAHSWLWAGPTWQQQPSREHARRITEVTINTGDPRALAQRWAQVLGLEAPAEQQNEPALTLQDGVIKFVQSSVAAERIAGFGLHATREALPFTLCGTRFSQAS